MRVMVTGSLFLLGMVGLASAAEPLPSVDFESVPAKPSSVEGTVISGEYWSTAGVRFTAPAGQSLLLAKAGEPRMAFSGFDGVADEPQPGAQLGEYFLTSDRAGTGEIPGPFEIDYRWPVQTASAVFLDVNGQESWKAEAFDAAGNSRGQITVWPTPFAGSSIKWTLDVGQPVITKVRITFTGRVTGSDGVTFAFDNIRGSRAVCLADVNGDSLIDFADYLDFLDAYERGEARADLTQDGIIDFGDYLDFLAAYDVGC